MHPPPLCLSLALNKFDQEVAGEHSQAFTGCSGLADILKGLEQKEVAVPIGKPQAIKRKHKLIGSSAKTAKAVAGAKTAKAVAVANTAKAVAAANTAKAVAVGSAGSDAPAEAVDVVAAPALKVSRKCVTSRAYHGAKRDAKDQGKSKAEQQTAAQLAYKTAGEKWDQEHA